MDNILNRVKDKIDEVQATKKVGKINEPKYATIYIARARSLLSHQQNIDQTIIKIVCVYFVGSY
jgi:hypothetical protein